MPENQNWKKQKQKNDLAENHFKIFKVFPKHLQQIAAFNFVEPMEKQKDRPQCHLKKSGPFVSLLQRLLRASEPENRINTIFRHQTNADTVSVPNLATFLGAAISLPIRL